MRKKNKNVCQLRDLNPRPFGIAPKATALDRSAKLTSNYYSVPSLYRQFIVLYFFILLPMIL